MLVQEILTSNVEAWASLGHPALLERFVLGQGREMLGQKRPPEFKRGVIKQCFSNSYAVAGQYGLRYVEGFALSASLKDIGFVVHHAWVLDAQGKVIDVTFERPEDSLYFGVEIPEFDLIAETSRTGTHCVLDGMGLNTRYMFSRMPELREALEETQAEYERTRAMLSALRSSTQKPKAP